MNVLPSFNSFIFLQKKGRKSSQEKNQRLAVFEIQTAFSVTECPLIRTVVFANSTLRLRLLFFRPFLSLYAGVFAVVVVVVVLVVGARGNTIVVDVVCVHLCVCAFVRARVCVCVDKKKVEKAMRGRV